MFQVIKKFNGGPETEMLKSKLKVVKKLKANFLNDIKTSDEEAKLVDSPYPLMKELKQQDHMKVVSKCVRLNAYILALTHIL